LLDKALQPFCTTSGGLFWRRKNSPPPRFPSVFQTRSHLSGCVFCPLHAHENMPFFHRFGFTSDIAKAALFRTSTIRRDPFTGAA